MPNRQLKNSSSIGILLCSLIHTAQALAGGFTLIEYSAQGIANGISGGGAVAEDASTVWHNPASMNRLPSQLQVVAHAVFPKFDFTDEGSMQTLPGGATSILLPQASTTAGGGSAGLVPSLYYIQKINDKLTFGLAVNMPFGLVTKYDAGWKGRYQTVTSKLLDVNVNPAVALRVSDSLSLGVGLNANYINARFTQALDVTAACLSAAQPFGSAAVATCSGFDPTSATLGAGQGGNDGFVEQEADDVSFGYNLGVFYEPSEHTRFSLAYRSQVNHKLDGYASFSLPATISAAPSIEAGVRTALADSGLQSSASLPDSLSLSAYHRLHPKFAVMGSLTWAGWSDIAELRFVYDNPETLGGTYVEELRWKDVWRVGLGVHYYHSQDLIFRAGVAYDPTPVPNPELRTPRLPDNDRRWVAFGASYRLDEKVSVDISYAHLFIRDTKIARVANSGSVLTGRYESEVDMFGLQVNVLLD